MHTEKQIPIWFFVGLILLIYGLLILASGIHGALNPPPVAERVQLWHLHADIWWGALLVLVGSVYVSKFRPGRA